MKRFDLLIEMGQLLRENKKWWMIPVVAMLLLLGGVMVFAAGSALAPFIYTIF